MLIIYHFLTKQNNIHKNKEMADDQLHVKVNFIAHRPANFSVEETSIQGPYCITISGRGMGRNRGREREAREWGRGSQGFSFFHLYRYRNEVKEGATQPMRSEIYSDQAAGEGLLAFTACTKVKIP